MSYDKQVILQSGYPVTSMTCHVHTYLFRGTCCLSTSSVHK